MEPFQNSKMPLVSTHSRPKAAGKSVEDLARVYEVSTHSRPKAAGLLCLCRSRAAMCFNTQPPEGGWTNQVVLILAVNTFQHTAARRRLGRYIPRVKLFKTVSTHSRPKAAGLTFKPLNLRHL